MKKVFLVLLSASMVLGACKKKGAGEEEKVGGCTDPDSPAYASGLDFDDGSCKYAYVTEIEVMSFPSDDNGQAWDAFAIGNERKADIYFKFKPQSQADYASFFTSYDTPIDNADPAVSHIWTSANQFKLTSESWYWELVDKDGVTAGADDYIASGTINPISLITNVDSGYLTLSSTDGETQIKVKFLYQ